MEGVDPDTLLEWLQTGVGDERDLQLMALEQLCMTLLMSDNIDRCFESCPPRTFLPALGRLFLDETAPENILEVTARAITYYLDVSNECTRRITQVDGAIKAICHRLVIAEMTDRTSKDLAEQCVKLLEHICQRESSVVYDSGGLSSLLHLIKHHDHLHKDTMHSAMAVVTKLCSKIEPNDSNLSACCKDLGDLLGHDDERVAECALRCFAAITDRFMRRQIDPVELTRPSNLLTHLFNLIGTVEQEENSRDLNQSGTGVVRKKNSSFVSTVLSLFINLSKTSPAITEEILSSQKLVPSLKGILTDGDERCTTDCLRFIDLLIILLFEGRASIPKNRGFNTDSIGAQIFDKTHRNLIDAIRLRDTDALIDAVENGTVNPNFVDDVGQTLLNWCSAFGTPDMVIYLCDKGADPNKGQRSPSLHYAACFGRAEIVKILLRYGANPDLQDEECRTALDKARERNDEGHQQVAEILQNPGAYINIISANAQFAQNKATNQAALLDTNIAEKDKIDPKLGETFIQQLLPLFCMIYKNSLAVSIRRTTLLLIRKCVFHISPESLRELTDVNIFKMEECTVGCGERSLVELLVGVVMLVFESNESNSDAKEQALMTIKSLLIKDAEFWAEQLIRLGVYEKIESLALETSRCSFPSNADQAEMEGQSSSTSRPTNIISSSQVDDKKENVTLAIGSYDRSETSTPSMSLRSDSTAPSTDFLGSVSEPTHYSNNEIVVHADSATPSPTVEILPRHTLSSSAALHAEEETHPSSNDANSQAFDNDLVEAATTIADALGVQIVQDMTEQRSEQHQQTLVMSTTNVKDGLEDVWTMDQCVFYRWKDWRLIRTRDSLFIWCDAVALELSDGSNGWLRFMMNGRLSTLYSSGSPEYGTDNADTRAEFIEKLNKAKSAVPAGSQTKPILSIPRSTLQSIQSGNWILASSESGSFSVSNREGTQQKLIIKEDLPGFIFESSQHHKQLFTADSILGHDFVTGWAARSGGKRLRYFRVEVQKQKVYELAREIWETYLRKARDKPREVVLDAQNCASSLSKMVKVLTLAEDEHKDLEIMNNLRSILIKIRDILIDERLLSIFEVSVSSLVPALLELLEQIKINRNGELAKCFSEVFADSKHLSLLVHKIVMVLEFVEKFPQFLYDAPGGSPFGFQFLTRRLRFRFELSDQNSDSTSTPFVDITNRSLKCEPLVTVESLKAYLYEHITNSKAKCTSTGAKEEPSSSKGLSNLNYGRPPTAASLRTARKLPKMIDKSGGTAPFSATSSSTIKHPSVPSDVLSARSAYMAAGCLERVGGNIKVKQPTGKASTAKTATSKKSGGTLSSRAGKGAVIKVQKQNTQPQQVSDGKPNQCVTSKLNAEGTNGNNIGQQQQKSMSTTNLFDADRRKMQSSSVAFNQAASAESLQHQTPSLENLLSKARLHDCSIPEESMVSPNSGSPEPKNLPTFDNFTKFETRFEKRKGSEDAQSISIGASSFAGGSQPVLNSASFSRDRLQVSSAERLEPNQIGSSIETINEVSQKAEAEETNSQVDAAFDNTKRTMSANTEYEAEMDNDEIEEEEGLIPGLKETENLFNLLAGDEEAEENMPKQHEHKGKEHQTKNKTETVVSAGESSSLKNETQQQSAGQNSSNPTSQLQNIGSNIRVRLGNYAEVLRNMMQHVLETGDNSDIYDVDEFDNDIYDDELHFIECDHSDGDGGFGILSDPSASTYITDHQQHPHLLFGNHPNPSAIGGVTEGPSNIMSTANAALAQRIDSLTNQTAEISGSAGGSSRAAAVAAIRAAIERSHDIIPSIPIDMLVGTTGSGSNSNELRHQQRWRQMLMEEFGSAIPLSMGMHNSGDGSKQRPPCDAGCARTIRMVSGRTTGSQTGGWNDDFVLRRQFGALIPAFDPRPGRTNVNQTQDVELPSEIQFSTYQRKGSIVQEDSKKGTTSSLAEDNSKAMVLFIKTANKENADRVKMVELKESDASLFRYVQELVLTSQQSNLCASSELNSQIWDQTFTLVYGKSTKRLVSENAFTKEDMSEHEKSSAGNGNDVVENQLVLQALNVLKILNELTQQKATGDGCQCQATTVLPSISLETFHSTKLTQKLSQELADPLIVSAKTLPNWCNYLVCHFPCLFSIDTRIMYMNTTAFGTSRAIGHLQSRRDQILEQNRSSTASTGSNMAGLRREDHYPEYRIGRVKHERIKVHRSEEMFLDNAIKVLKFHALRKEILEIEYHGEEGTGLGPTLEFFGLVASEFQRRDLCMWQCAELVTSEDEENGRSLLDEALQHTAKPSGYYVHSNIGLFPAIWPASAITDEILEYFQICIFLAKAIQDNRLVDLPLSESFIKLMISPKLASDDEPSIKSVLDINDFAAIYAEKASVVKALMQFIENKKGIQSRNDIDGKEKARMANELTVEMDGDKFSLEDLSLTFAINPPTKKFPYQCAELVENGASVEVDSSNVEEYVQKMLEFHLDKGIYKQICAFRYGFDMVFPLSTLVSFTPSEIQTLISGEQSPKWTREDLLRYTEPKLGYTRDSPGFLNFVDVLSNFDSVERKAFLQFTTGCSSLPPGGLANLHPRLTIVRKVGSGDGSYPSVNTCVHYLKLPEYTSKQALREKLLAATNEKGFHLN